MPGLQAEAGASLTEAPPGPSAEEEPALPPARPRLLLGTALLVLVLDQISKAIVVATLADRSPVELVGQWLRLTYVRNPGAAFSIGTGLTIVFSLIALTVSVVIVRLAPRLRSTGWAIALGGVLGGALGNLMDRLFRDPAPLRGEVIDWVQLPYWPVFNVADMAIVGSAILMVSLSFRGVQLDGSRR